MARADSLLLVALEGYALDDGTVLPAGTPVNRIAWDGVSKHVPPEGLAFAPDEGQRVREIPLPVTVPQAVAKWQLQVAMAGRPGQGGTLLDDANALAKQVGGVAAIAWAGAAEITRGSPLLNQMAPALGLSQADVDALFIAAAEVVA